MPHFFETNSLVDNIITGVILTCLIIILINFVVITALMIRKLTKGGFEIDVINRKKERYMDGIGHTYGGNIGRLAYATELSGGGSLLKRKDTFGSRGLPVVSYWPPDDENLSYDDKLAQDLISEATSGQGGAE